MVCFDFFYPCTTSATMAWKGVTTICILIGVFSLRSGHCEDLSSATAEVDKNRNDKQPPAKMSEGDLISTLFDLGLTFLGDYANEISFLEELEDNGTDIIQLIGNDTAINETVAEFQRRYSSRYGYSTGGVLVPLAVPVIIGGLWGLGKNKHGYGRGSADSSLVLAAMPSIAEQVIAKKGFGKSIGYTGNHGVSNQGFDPVQGSNRNGIHFGGVAKPDSGHAIGQGPLKPGNNEINHGGISSGVPGQEIPPGGIRHVGAGTGANVGAEKSPGSAQEKGMDPAELHRRRLAHYRSYQQRRRRKSGRGGRRG